MTMNQFHCTLEDQAIDIADGIEAQSASVDSIVYVVHAYDAGFKLYDAYTYEVERLPGGIDRGEYRRIWNFEYASDVEQLLSEECWPHTPSL